MRTNRRAQDARIARYVDRRLGLHRARRRAWRRTDGDSRAFPAAMREEAAGYLYPYVADEPLEPVPVESIARQLLRQCVHVTAVCCVAVVVIILSDLAGW